MNFLNYEPKYLNTISNQGLNPGAEKRKLDTGSLPLRLVECLGNFLISFCHSPAFGPCFGLWGCQSENNQLQRVFAIHVPGLSQGQWRLCPKLAKVALFTSLVMLESF